MRSLSVGLRRCYAIACPGSRDRAAGIEEPVGDDQADEPDHDHDGDHDQHGPQGPAPGHLHTAVLVVVDLGRRHGESMRPRMGPVKQANQPTSTLLSHEAAPGNERPFSW
jgi:hypothetical protein